MTCRRRKLLEMICWNVAPLGVGLLFLFVIVPLFRDVLHLPLVCPFETIFHLYCPGCGGSRAALALLSFDIGASLRDNPTVLALLLALLAYDVSAVAALIRGSDDFCRAPWYKTLRRIGISALVAVFVGQFLVRNLLLVVWQIDPLGDLAAFWTR